MAVISADRSERFLERVPLSYASCLMAEAGKSAVQAAFRVPEGNGFKEKPGTALNAFQSLGSRTWRNQKIALKHGFPPFYFRLRYAMTAILYDMNSIAHPAAMPIVMTAP